MLTLREHICANSRIIIHNIFLMEKKERRQSGETGTTPLLVLLLLRCESRPYFVLVENAFIVRTCVRSAPRTIHFEFQFNRLLGPGRATAYVFDIIIIVKLLLQTDAVFVRFVTATAAHCTAYWANAEADSFSVHVLLCWRGRRQLYSIYSHV